MSVESLPYGIIQLVGAGVVDVVVDVEVVDVVVGVVVVVVLVEVVVVDVVVGALGPMTTMMPPVAVLLPSE